MLDSDEERRVEPLHADATAPGALDGATHLYMANLCFPDALNRAMVGALAAVASLRCVATLRPLPLDEEWPRDARACRPKPVALRPAPVPVRPFSAATPSSRPAPQRLVRPASGSVGRLAGSTGEAKSQSLSEFNVRVAAS